MAPYLCFVVLFLKKIITTASMFLAEIGNMCTYTNVIINLKKFIELKSICDNWNYWQSFSLK